MIEKCPCGKNCIVTKENLKKKLDELKPCPNCKSISIKKFKPLKDYENYDKINKDYYKCKCGKRPLDIVMSHILKIMIEEKIVPENANLRRNSAIPLPYLCTLENPEQIGENSLIIIHKNFNEKIANKILNEVCEVKGILKGEGTIGILEKNSSLNEYKLLAGCDMRCDLLYNDIIINKKQSTSHIEVSTTTERKLIKLNSYLKKYKNTRNLTAIDGMCGNGSLGIYLLKYGFNEVIFNDIYQKACESTKLNLKINGFKSEVLNNNFEDIEIEKVDLCIIDGYPNVNIDEIISKAHKIAKDVLII